MPKGKRGAYIINIFISLFFDNQNSDLISASPWPVYTAYIINIFISLFLIVIIACPDGIYKPVGQAIILSSHIPWNNPQRPCMGDYSLPIASLEVRSEVRQQHNIFFFMLLRFISLFGYLIPWPLIPVLHHSRIAARIKVINPYSVNQAVFGRTFTR